MGKTKRRGSDDESSSSRIENLRGEIRKLRKQVKQLQKENSRLLNRNESVEELFSEECDYIDIPSKPQCPKCASYNVGIIEGLKEGKDYYFCKQCGARGPLKD